MVFVGHGHFSRSVMTRWIEQPIAEGIRVSMAAASLAVCGFEHGVRQISALGLTGHRIPVCPREEPTFVLTGRDGVVIADGVDTAYPVLDDARAALASGAAPMIVGALPFDVTRPTALMRPERVRVTAALPDWPAGACRPCTSPTRCPTPQNTGPASPRPWNDYATPTVRCTRWCWRGRCGCSPTMCSTSPPSSGGWPKMPPPQRYFVDLTAAGARYAATALIGASPELLVARRGEVLTCRPFAGSAPRSADPETDRANGAALAASAKNLHEHQLVVDQMRAALQPLCVDLDIASAPELSSTSAVWHLNTPITGAAA